MKSGKPLDEQVIVLTGASSGMLLTTARMAAQRGARLVLAARNEEALKSIEEELKADGHEALYVVADVSKRADVQNIADRAIERFGHFDTWVNGVGLTTYATMEKLSLEDHRRLFDINYWGMVHGSLIAVRHLRQRGGTLINLGSILSDRAIAFQGPYCATKHAVKAFTDALRMELEQDGAPVNVTLIKPSSIDTPLRFHAKNLFSREGMLPPPAYAPWIAAEAILHCAEHPRRDLVIGGGGRLVTLLGNLFPRAMDWAMEYTAYSAQTTDESPGRLADHGLYSADSQGKRRGRATEVTGLVREDSLYTRAQLRPGRTAIALLALGAVAAVTITHRRHRAAPARGRHRNA